MTARYGLLHGIVVVALLVAASIGCGRTRQPPPAAVTRLRLSWPNTGLFATELAAAYRQSPGVAVTLVTVPDNTRAVQDGRADMTITLADIAYFANRESQRLRSIAALEVIPIQVVVRQGARIATLADLRGRSLAGSALNRATQLLLDAAGLKGQVRFVGGARDASTAMQEDGLDGLIAVSYFPDPVVETALRNGGRLMPLEGDAVERAQRTYPFIRRTTIPANAYPGQTAPVRTIGTNMIFVCRKELDEQVVHTLAEGLFQALPRMSQRIQPLRAVNVERASAVPIPLHEGAARYYREREVQ